MKRTRALPNTITAALLEFIREQRFAGILLIICTVLSLVLANSAFSESYLHMWHYDLTLGFSEFSGKMSISHFINDALMAIFFLLVGLEIKRELKDGELSSFGKAALPFMAAIGGMVIPAAFYLIFNAGTITQHGWGIPMATDIAFAIGILSILGKRVPDSLKVLLTALAVVDDLGAVLVIAIFYTQSIAAKYLLYAGVVFVILLILNFFRVRFVLAYLILGVFLWYFVLQSGVHATIAGVLLAFTIPFNRNHEKNPLVQLEHGLYTPVNYLIMPLFALANTAIVIESGVLGKLANNESLGIGLGLLIGKPLGIFAFTWFAVKSRLCRMPTSTTFRQILGVGFLGGIGFTMSIFIALLAFENPEYIVNAKIAILVSSFFAGIFGFYLLKSSIAKPVQNLQELKNT
ncbi:MAG: Na+/H+ antiporter NhaA [Bacteroidetes bacterium]|nr:MAG: Na+/H+ antiporter NhaA [Bacteroidota bacterium]REK00069.1 MAG: Na+/H+ antiporter NhaA [Bacteroidota bacterium]REK34289.1 MAG: Na+/H+ antiporter NhaA [Bacteroidota bacterium]REK50699.1 MAG: Na+/H+ antiporter NhaA [Bacteroidota bacterium]